MSAGALSMYILCEYLSLTTAINQYAKRFGLNKYLVMIYMLIESIAALVSSIAVALLLKRIKNILR
ncbi:MAG: hypothetical protein ACKPKO_28275 [Candidatus Fonsibacter sp.]